MSYFSEFQIHHHIAFVIKVQLWHQVTKLHTCKSITKLKCIFRIVQIPTRRKEVQRRQSQIKRSNRRRFLTPYLFMDHVSTHQADNSEVKYTLSRAKRQAADQGHLHFLLHVNARQNLFEETVWLPTRNSSHLHTIGIFEIASGKVAQPEHCICTTALDF